MKITLDLLKKMPSGEEACLDAQIWFNKSFPEGGWLVEVIKKAPIHNWKIWFTCNYLQGIHLDEFFKLVMAEMEKVAPHVDITNLVDEAQKKWNSKNKAYSGITTANTVFGWATIGKMGALRKKQETWCIDALNEASGLFIMPTLTVTKFVNRDQLQEVKELLHVVYGDEVAIIEDCLAWVDHTDQDKPAWLVEILKEIEAMDVNSPVYLSFML